MNMMVSAIERSVRAADLPLERLSGSTQVSEQEKISEACRQFEAVLLRQILSQAQKPLFTSNLMGESGTHSIYRDMIVDQLADRISQGGSFGFARVLEKEFNVQLGAQEQTAPAEKAAAAPRE